jgi:tRNA(Ile2) C34 agmatinyltransferase TiaS
MKKIERLKSPATRHWSVKQDICPECGGELDTGWECNSCGFDAMPIIKHGPTGAGGGER